jgi:uncharacterized SAM-binding protein YcdF (DUF218 family)
MSIFLSKFLPVLTYPLGLACLLLVAAFILKRRLQWSRYLPAVALLLLWVGGNTWVSHALARSLEWQNLPPASLPEAEVIVVLGGGTEAALYPRQAVEVNSAGDRMLYAAHLYKQGAANHILLSGGNIDWMSSDSSSPAADMADIMSLAGVPGEALWLENRSLNTYENALYAKEYLQARGINRIILVTSAMHMPRARALFEHQGLEVIPAPADFTVTQTDWEDMFTLNIPNQVINFFPNASSLSLTTNVLKEYFGILVSTLRGQI